MEDESSLAAKMSACFCAACWHNQSNRYLLPSRVNTLCCPTEIIKRIRFLLLRLYLFFHTPSHRRDRGAAWLAFECFLMKKEIPAVGWWAAGSSRSARWCVFLLKRRIRRAPAFVIRRCHCDDATWGQIDRPIYIIIIYPLCWKERKRRALQQWKVLSNPLPSSISIKTIVVYIQYPLVLLWLFI